MFWSFSFSSQSQQSAPKSNVLQAQWDASGAREGKNNPVSVSGVHREPMLMKFCSHCYFVMSEMYIEWYDYNLSAIISAVTVQIGQVVQHSGLRCKSMKSIELNSPSKEPFWIIFPLVDPFWGNVSTKGQTICLNTSYMWLVQGVYGY